MIVNYLEYELCHAQSVELGYIEDDSIPSGQKWIVLTIHLHILAISM